MRAELCVGCYDLQMQHAQKGNASLIGLLVGVALVAVGSVYFYLTPREVTNPELRAVQPLTASGTVPGTELERSRADVDAAKATQELINAHNRATNSALGEEQ